MADPGFLSLTLSTPAIAPYELPKIPSLHTKYRRGRTIGRNSDCIPVIIIFV